MESLELAEKHRYHDRVIDFLRGVAALTVFVSHADHAGLVQFKFFTDHKIFMGRYGVYLFFVLSGYLIWSSAQRTLSRPRGLAVYAVHRITRIVPLYLINLLFVIVALEALGSAFEPNINQTSIFRHLIFSQSLVPSVSRDLNPVLWTLTHEAIYYALRVRGWKVVGLATLLLVLHAAGFRTVFTPFLILFYLFVFGVLVAERHTETMIGGTVALLVLLYWAPPLGPTEFAAALSAAATFLLVWPVCRICARFPRVLWLMQPVCWVGLISYSVYIWHYLIINIVGTEKNWRVMYALFGPVWINNYGRALAFTAFVLLVSAISYFLFEKPGMTWLRNHLVRVVTRSQKQAIA